MTKNENEMLRHALLETLGLRAGIALPVAGIMRRSAGMVDFKFTPENAEAELEVLKGLGLVEFHFDELGSTKYWEATAKGVLFVERGL